METPDEVFQEKLESLGQAEHRFSGYHEGGYFFASVVDNFTLVGRGVVGGYRNGWGAVAERSKSKG